MSNTTFDLSEAVFTMCVVCSINFSITSIQTRICSKSASIEPHSKNDLQLLWYRVVLSWKLCTNSLLNISKFQYLDILVFAQSRFRKESHLFWFNEMVSLPVCAYESKSTILQSTNQQTNQNEQIQSNEKPTHGMQSGFSWNRINHSKSLQTALNKNNKLYI